ncbi:Transposase [Thiorhodovibrio winogradskyi]|uniref:Transposase n=1 Tax=Thiorhodovibrio winogradskyi TaxID=77007 RepID=A0ABZ0S9C6_9GAMM|nr:IS1595 family transposase [Thiorhodovibrio winogradskyi]
MPINRVQFQPGLSLPSFLAQFGTEAQCQRALEQARWPEGFRCPECGHANAYILRGGTHKLFQCQACRKQTSLIAGTLFQSTHLALTVWFLAIYLISQAKTGLSALALKRQVGVSYRTAWLIQHKLMQARSERDSAYTLAGDVQVDDVYLGGELTGGKAGRGSENKVPFVAAVSLTPEGHPQYAKMTPVPGFTRKAISEWAASNLSPGCLVTSDGLACFNGVTDAGCLHNAIVVGGLKPKDLPEFNWINTILGNLKTSFGGAYHAFDFSKYASRYLATFAYRFNRRFHLDTIHNRLLVAAATIGARSELWLRGAEEAH